MKQKFFRVLADLRFTIFILLVISVCSIVGTIIEQDQSIETYKTNYPLINPIFGFISWPLIIQLGLDHIYKTWWFLTLIVLLGSSLILCTFLQQLPALKIARRCQFFRTSNSFYKLTLSTILLDFSSNKILARLKSKQYSIFQQKNMIYCYKGLIGRIAPIMVHFSLICILLGTIIGALFGFKAQEIIPKTEIFHIQNILNNGPVTFFSQTSARVNDFWITYTPTKTISQFYSNISILNNQGMEIMAKTVSVNSPLIYKNIYYYQTDWNLIGLRFQTFTNKIMEYPLLNIFENQNKVWVTWIITNTISKNGILLVIDNLEGYCSIYNEIGQFLGNLELNETIKIPLFLTFFEIISSTGLQIKTDPGIPIIYLGFFFLMLSTLVSYITYSQVWLIKNDKKIFIGGNTNRATFEFELEFLKIVK